MNVSGEFTVNAPRDGVFRTLRDPSSFVRFVDGVSDLKEIDPTHYEAVFETKVAYLKFKFAVTVEVTRMDEPSVIEAKIEGTPLGALTVNSPDTFMGYAGPYFGTREKRIRRLRSNAGGSVRRMALSRRRAGLAASPQG